MARVLVIDNYDSFVYNLVQYLGQLGVEPLVQRNDELSPSAALDLGAVGILVSPGPGRPEQAGMSMEVIARAEVPVLGVCLGHQCIGAVFGADVVRHGVVHGKTSQIGHDGRGVFAGLPDPLTATRYHSLVVDPSSLPDALEVSAWAEDGTIMGLRHRARPLEGVQFHPESILTTGGHQLLANWLSACGISPESIPTGP